MSCINQFAIDERQRLENFVAWYKSKAKENPEQYPLELPEDNEGLWHEMFADFDES